MDKLPRYIQVSSTLEFSRLVCALERAPRISFLHEHEGRKILSVQMDVLKEKPIVYYTPLENKGHFLCYTLRGEKEQTEIVNSTQMQVNFTPNCTYKITSRYFETWKWNS